MKTIMFVFWGFFWSEGGGGYELLYIEILLDLLKHRENKYTLAELVLSHKLWINNCIWKYAKKTSEITYRKVRQESIQTGLTQNTSYP